VEHRPRSRTPRQLTGSTVETLPALAAFLLSASVFTTVLFAAATTASVAIIAAVSALASTVVSLTASTTPAIFAIAFTTLATADTDLGATGEGDRERAGRE
jgi:hypothetical protein